VPKTTITQNGFNSGELSPFLNARVEIDRYFYGVRTLLNFIPMLQGPARKRPGFKYVSDLKEKCWLLPIVFSQTDSWIAAFGDSKVKFFTDHGPVLESAVVITGVSSANPGVITAASHGYSTGDEVFLQAIGGTTQLNSRSFIVTVLTANTFTLTDMWGTAVNTTSMGTYTSGGTSKRHYQIVSPYTTSNLTDSTTGCCLMSTAQSVDVTYICVPGFQPRKLTRTSSTSWAFSLFEPTGGPFIGADPDETITIQASAATGSGITLTASSATVFAAGRVGSLFLVEKPLTDVTNAWEAGKSISGANQVRRSQGHYYNSGGAGTTGTVTPTHTEGSRVDGDAGVSWTYHHSGYGWVEITAVGGGGTTATCDVIHRLPAGSVSATTTQWSQGAWSDTLGWPTHVCFFRERLWFARGTKLWGSVPSDFENFAERDAGVVADDSAISIDIRQGYNDDIQWLLPSSDLLVGSLGNEFSIGEISTADPLGPGNIASLRGPGYGARRVAPALINDGVMYVLPGGRVLRELRYAFESDGYVALNRTAFAEHITKGQINRLAFAKEPESVLWGSCADGALIGMSFEREHQLQGWHRHTIGGSLSTGSPVVEDIAVIPSTDGGRDELYTCTKRTINGATKHYLEYNAAHWDENADDLDDMFYVDSGLSNESNTSVTISGLEHLIGETVKVLGDGRDMSGDGYTVSSSGSITLSSSDAPAVVHVGLAYTAELESMPLAMPGFLLKIAKAFVRFVSSVLVKASGYTSTDRDTRKSWGPRAVGWTWAGQSVTAPAQPVTRIVEIADESDHGQEVFFKLTHDFPTACTIAGWALQAEAE
jgi:hypothetical protein